MRAIGWLATHCRWRASWVLLAAVSIGACAPGSPPSPSVPAAAAPAVGQAAVGAAAQVTAPGGSTARGAAAAPILLPTAPGDTGTPGPHAIGVTVRRLTRSSNTTGEPRALDTTIWYPATAGAAALPRHERFRAPVDAPPGVAGRPFPVLVNSPGAGGGIGANSYLNTHLASHGFIVVGVQHPGTTPPPCPFQPCLPTNPDAREWVLEQLANRPDDVRFTLQSVLELSAAGDSVLAGMLDTERLGMAGGSSGGITALEVVADDPRFRAVVPMAPAGSPADRRHGRELAAQITLPAMVLAGELDTIPYAEQEAMAAAFPSSAPERWFVGLPRAGHSMLLDWCPDGFPECGPDALPLPHALPLPETHARVNRWVTAFLLRYVAGDARYASLLDPVLAAGDPEVRVGVWRAP
jgi:predicted dienelactone hydrolase